MYKIFKEDKATLRNKICSYKNGFLFLKNLLKSFKFIYRNVYCTKNNNYYIQRKKTSKTTEDDFRIQLLKMKKRKKE